MLHSLRERSVCDGIACGGMCSLRERSMCDGIACGGDYHVMVDTNDCSHATHATLVSTAADLMQTYVSLRRC